MKYNSFFLGAECLLLFGMIPGVLYLYQQKADVPFFPVLFGLLLLTLLIAGTDPNVQFRPVDSSGTIKSLIGRFMIVAGLLMLITLLFVPQLLFGLPRENPLIWFLVMLLYPLLSVAPQEFLFRTFFMQRYRPIFGEGKVMLWSNALAFGWAHIFFLNWIAPVLSVIAGALLAHTWQKHKSFKLVCLEHAIYGQIVFTCGLGWFFYQGSTRALQQMVP